MIHTVVIENDEGQICVGTVDDDNLNGVDIHSMIGLYLYATLQDENGNKIKVLGKVKDIL